MNSVRIAELQVTKPSFESTGTGMFEITFLGCIRIELCLSSLAVVCVFKVYRVQFHWQSTDYSRGSWNAVKFYIRVAVFFQFLASETKLQKFLVTRVVIIVIDSYSNTPLTKCA